MQINHTYTHTHRGIIRACAHLISIGKTSFYIVSLLYKYSAQGLYGVYAYTIRDEQGPVCKHGEVRLGTTLH